MRSVGVADDSVYVGKYRGRKVAISEFREHLSESMASIPRLSEADDIVDIRELKLLSEFSHPNIVKFVSHPDRTRSFPDYQRGICIPEDNSQIPCMLVSELCENGDLFDYIVSPPIIPNPRLTKQRNVDCPTLKRLVSPPCI